MAMKTVLFDLDGTLLPVPRQEDFVAAYFDSMAAYMGERGYDPAWLHTTMWAGIHAMVKNDGQASNREAFRRVAAACGVSDIPTFEAYFDTYYRGVYDGVKTTCGYTPRAREILQLVRDSGAHAVLATNPLFPQVAIEKRLAWAGLSPDDFVLCTTYETSHFSKPNPAYYAEILEKIGAKPEECLMVGNDTGDDLPAGTLGMPVFLLTDCLINKNGTDIATYPHGDYDALVQFLEVHI